MNKVYAEDVNYWQTSKTAPDTWIDRAKKLIVSIGGRVTSEAFGTLDGKSVYMLAFQIGEDRFVIRWAVLPTRSKNAERAAKIQAATLLFHDVKHKVVMAKIKGVRTSFLEYLLLPNGQVASEAAGDAEGFAQLLPQLMLSSGER